MKLFATQSGRIINLDLVEEILLPDIDTGRIHGSLRFSSGIHIHISDEDCVELSNLCLKDKVMEIEEVKK